MPRSRSRSMSSRTWLRKSRAVMAPVLRRNWSARVLLPWSMWAMMEKLRMQLRVGHESFRLGPSWVGMLKGA